jgi:hypothetical protein
MFAVRSAICLLALSMAISHSVVSASSVGTSGGSDHGVFASPTVGYSIGEPGVASLSEAASLSRATFRRARLKAVVLEDTDHELDEIDLGRIPVPRTLNSRTSVAMSPPFFPKTCRLRC